MCILRYHGVTCAWVCFADAPVFFGGVSEAAKRHPAAAGSGEDCGQVYAVYAKQG